MTQISKEYAQALFDLSQETHTEADVRDALSDIRALFWENSDYIEFLAAPDIPIHQREQALLDAFDGKLPDTIVAFLVLLCKRGRIRQVFDCIAAFDALYDAYVGISTAEVVSVVELTESEKARLLIALEKKCGHRVRMECHTDPGLLGGLIVTLDGKVTDGSLRHRLNEVREVMNP